MCTSRNIKQIAGGYTEWNTNSKAHRNVSRRKSDRPAKERLKSRVKWLMALDNSDEWFLHQVIDGSWQQWWVVSTSCAQRCLLKSCRLHPNKIISELCDFAGTLAIILREPHEYRCGRGHHLRKEAPSLWGDHRYRSGPSPASRLDRWSGACLATLLSADPAADPPAPFPMAVNDRDKWLPKNFNLPSAEHYECCQVPIAPFSKGLRPTVTSF